MVTKEEFQAAESIVEEYRVQLCESLTEKVRTCICCKSNKVQILESFYVPHPLEQNKGCWDNGTVEKISFGYGSKLDTERFYIAICDECMEGLVTEGLATPLKGIDKKVRAFY